MTSAMPATMQAGPVVLRRCVEAHLAAQLAAMEQSIDELRRWMDWAADGVPAPDAFRASLRGFEAEFDGDVAWLYSLFDAADDELVGGCGLQRMTDEHRLELSYWVRSDRVGRGYATEAAGALTDAAFAALPEVDTIEMHVDCANAASARIPEKLGYRLVGTEPCEIRAHGHTGRRDVWSIARPDRLRSGGPDQG